MTSADALQLVRERAGAAGVSLTVEEASRLLAYYDLLAHWNRIINLTALKLSGYPASTLDRLVIEPIVSKGLTVDRSGPWFDLGSGGGSPAIPLKILRPELRLTMVESRTRKGAFLREAIRTLELVRASVLTDRLENLNESVTGCSADLVTVRALKVDKEVVATSAYLLATGGTLVVLGNLQPPEVGASAFVFQRSIPLPSPNSAAHAFTRS